ncbi:general odorant-binding protein 99a-like [Hermetia illucens]|uniref:general odorant-binding protein 99a-like n=1 Tax=Hermetia illucens TaxID=343691 RepID=UPI0018CC41E8|nr:general odorant-binding protein 99a-like [Hermetia illucens]
MKYFIVFYALIAMAFAQWTREDLLKHRKKCLKYENVPKSVIEKLDKRQYNKDLGPEGRCYLRCLGLKSGAWDDTNGFDIEKSYQILLSTGFNVNKENLQKCITTNTGNDDKCTWAANNLMCLWTNKYISWDQ